MELWIYALFCLGVALPPIFAKGWKSLAWLGGLSVVALLVVSSGVLSGSSGYMRPPSSIFSPFLLPPWGAMISTVAWKAIRLSNRSH